MMLLKAYYQIPFLGSEKMKLNLLQLQKIEKARDDLMHLFRFFIRGNWEFANENLYKVMKCMSAEEVNEFNADCTSFDWMPFIRNYMAGIAIYALKEDKVEPMHRYEQLLGKNKGYFHDLNLALKPRKNFVEKHSQVYEASILNEDRFLDFFEMNQAEQKKEAAAKYQTVQMHKYNEKLVQKELERVRAGFFSRSTQLTFYIFNKIANHLAENLNIYKPGIEMIK